MTTELTREEVVTIESLVRTQLGNRVRDLRLIVHGEGLILRGQTDSYYAKLLAQHGVMKATSLPIVANEIRVG